MALTGRSLRVAGYRFRATFGRRWGGYLSLVLLVGLVGGLSMGALAGARRTQSSFATYLASTNPSNLGITVFGGVGNGGGSAPSYSPSAVEAIDRLPGVKHVEAAIPIAAAPLAPDGAPRLGAINDIQPVASVDGLFFDQDRLAVIAGRMADPNRPDEIVMTAFAAQLLGVHVGEVIPYGVYTHRPAGPAGIRHGAASRRTSASTPRWSDWSNKATQSSRTTSTGSRHSSSSPRPSAEEIVAEGGARRRHHLRAPTRPREQRRQCGGAGVRRRMRRPATPTDSTPSRPSRPRSTGRSSRWPSPSAYSAGVAALAALLIGLQLISRQLRDAEEESSVLRGLGAGPTTIAADGLIGILASIVVGSLLAAAVAVALSPLSPLGPVRPVYPDAGDRLRLDGARHRAPRARSSGSERSPSLSRIEDAPHRVLRRSRVAPGAHSRAVHAAASAGLPPPAVIGVRFALEPGHGRTAVPVRSALFGAVLAVALVVATFTFGSGLQSLVSHPALYGWNFSYLLNASNTTPPQALALLDHDPDVVAWDGYDYNDAEIDGQGVPFLFEHGHSATKAPISPPILAGHAVEGKDQIVLGAATLAQLHKHIGDTVVVTYGTPGNPVYVPPTRLVVVGTATMPAVGFSSVIDDHTSMGTGALMSDAALPARSEQALSSSDPTLNGPNLVFVRLRDGVPAAAGLANLQRIAAAANKIFAAVPGGAGAGRHASPSSACNGPPRS